MALLRSSLRRFLHDSHAGCYWWGLGEPRQEDRHQRRNQFDFNVALRSIDQPTATRPELEQIERDAQAAQHRQQREER